MHVHAEALACTCIARLLPTSRLAAVLLPFCVQGPVGGAQAAPCPESHAGAAADSCEADMVSVPALPVTARIWQPALNHWCMRPQLRLQCCAEPIRVS